MFTSLKFMLKNQIIDKSIWVILYLSAADTFSQVNEYYFFIQIYTSTVFNVYVFQLYILKKLLCLHQDANLDLLTLSTLTQSCIIENSQRNHEKNNVHSYL